MSRTYEELFAEVADWADETFPGSQPAAKVAHLRKEVEELEADPTNGEEMADCLMILVHLARGTGIDLKAELRRKLAINRGRQWGAPDARGVVEHIR